ncbi:MAG: asparagine synthase (glutamine-hydrolyzing) [Acidobacteriota bacterium]|nr:asparagine synthase (glutamine-hydrolyzing) [Acidobacteriota bacterium]
MTARLRHRGPDASATRFCAGGALVFARLQILDLSPSGEQPMCNEAQTVWTIFNGEIYNHHELRDGLEKKGHKFRGTSDGEIFPHLYEELGVDLVRNLRGMFALAIYDSTAGTLLLARDRFGIKPLFFAARPATLAFASEINALRATPDIDLSPDPQALRDLAALFYIPAPETVFRGIRSLMPGEILEAKLSGGFVQCRSIRYHTWSIQPDLDLTATTAADRAEALIVTAVGRELESDVALGTLLSGGIDSSLVSAAAQRATATQIRSFNVRFSEAEFDETSAAVAVAQKIGTAHTSLDVPSGGGSWDAVRRLLQHAGQPFADTSLFAVQAISRRMRQHVTVALSGDGGDEAFGGYNQYWQLAAVARLQRLPPELWRIGATLLEPIAGAGLIRPSLPRRARTLIGADDASIIESLCTWLSPDEVDELCVIDGVSPTRRLFERQWAWRTRARGDRVEGLSALATEVGIRLTLPNDYLFKVDIASMSESLEVRVPMLDEELVEFGLTLPHALKVNGRVGKRVLREVARRWLPPAVVSRPKMGFVLPLDTWIDADVRHALREVVLSPSSRLRDFYHREVYEPWIDAFCNGKNFPGLSRESLFQRAIMLLAVSLTFEN